MNRNYDEVVGSFSNPFTSISSQWMPSSIKDMFKISEWVYMYSGVYRAAVNRVARMFLTEFAYETSESTSTLEFLKEFLEKHPKVKKSIVSIGTNLLVYGNAFVSVHLPFIRLVKCESCGVEQKAKSVRDLDFVLNQGFTGTCPLCGSSNNPFSHREIKDIDINNINVISWNLKQIEFVHNPISGTYTFQWTMPSSLVNKIKEGKGSILLTDTPMPYIEAAHRDQEVVFDDDFILYLKQENLSGLDIEWGIPPALACFPLIFYMAVLRKANEAIGMDYIVPLRILFPQSSTNKQEAGFMHLGEFVQQVRAIVQKHKLDPASWHVSPVPIGYHLIGGEKRALSVTDDIRFTTEEVLNAFGFSPQLFYGSMDMQATPMSLRLLENTYGLTLTYSHLTNWITSKALAYKELPDANVSMNPLRWADDIERKQIMLSLASANKISDSTVLEMYGTTFEREERKKLEQMQIARNIQESAEKTLLQDTQESQQGSTGGTPMDIQQQAEMIAQQLYVMDDNTRKAELARLNKQNSLLHAAAKKALDQIRNRDQTDGQHMIQQQKQEQSRVSQI